MRTKSADGRMCTRWTAANRRKCKWALSAARRSQDAVGVALSVPREPLVDRLESVTAAGSVSGGWSEFVSVVCGPFGPFGPFGPS